MVKFNVNNWSKVTLTKEGAEQINEYNRQYHGYSQSKEENEKYFPTSYKEGDVFEGELHQLFHIFGSKLAPGFNTPFLKNEITIFKYK